MMLKIKLILALLISVGLLSALWYVDHLRSENEVLTLNNANLHSAVDDWKQYAADQQADAELKSKQVRDRMGQIAQLTKKAATLSKELKNVTKHDPKVVECLGVKPGPDFINQLREYSQGTEDEGVGEDLSGPGVLPEPNS